MVSIHRRPSWALAERLATPETAFVNRRTLLAGLGAGAAALAAPRLIGAARAAEDPTAARWPAPREPAV
ncbi:MAG: protein-methionine-sulfoxide reductase catalytic subunit MsrP, partial [Nitratireductor sp.]